MNALEAQSVAASILANRRAAQAERSKPHTPGPWLVRDFPGQRGPVVTDSRPDENGQFVGQLIAVKTTAPETLANLRLIAAAPDLLSACQQMIERVNENMRSAACGKPPVGLVLTEVAAAVAKATGITDPYLV